MAMTPNCLFYASQSSLIVLCRGGVVVVNCEGVGLLVTGYDGTTPERRGQVVRLGFSTQNIFPKKMRIKNKTEN